MAMRGEDQPRVGRGWCGEAEGGMRKGEGRGGRNTYNTTNLRGLSVKTGNRAKQITKHARAPRLQAPNMRRRSHRLTVTHLVSRESRSSGSHAWLEARLDMLRHNP